MKPPPIPARALAPDEKPASDRLLGPEPTLPLSRRFLHNHSDHPASFLAAEPELGHVPDEEQLKGCVRRVLEKIRSGPRPAPTSTLTVRELFRLSPAERWAWPLRPGAVWTPRLIQDLLRLTEEEIPGSVVSAEEKLHFTLSLAARLPAETCRGTLAADLMAQAWALLADCALQKDDPAKADTAVNLARAHLECGSGDSLVLLEVNQRWGLLEWATGETAEAREVFESLARLAKSVGEGQLEARQQIWLYLLADQDNDALVAEEAYRRALALLGPDEFPRTVKSQLETARRLGCAGLAW